MGFMCFEPTFMGWGVDELRGLVFLYVSAFCLICPHPVHGMPESPNLARPWEPPRAHPGRAAQPGRGWEGWGGVV